MSALEGSDGPYDDGDVMLDQLDHEFELVCEVLKAEQTGVIC